VLVVEDPRIPFILTSQDARRMRDTIALRLGGDLGDI
jgi:hypothetical protein